MVSTPSRSSRSRSIKSSNKARRVAVAPVRCVRNLPTATSPAPTPSGRSSCRSPRPTRSRHALPRRASRAERARRGSRRAPSPRFRSGGAAPGARCRLLAGSARGFGRRRRGPALSRRAGVAAMAIPGSVEIHQAWSRLPRPSATIPPHDGVGGGTPSPRKESAASSRIVSPTRSVVSIDTGTIAAGSR